MKKIILLIFAALLSLSASAQYINLKGSATVKLKSATVSVEEKDRAITSASMNAIERYFSEKGEAQNQVFDNNQEKIENNLEKLVQNTSVLAEQLQSDIRRYQITVKIEINEARLKNIVSSGTAAKMAVNGEKSNIVYFFTARQANSVKSFDARIVKIGQANTQQDVTASTKASGTEGEKLVGSQISTNASKSVVNKLDATTIAKTESGGSVTNKREEIGYQILPMASYKPAVTSIFTQSGFSVIDSDYVLTESDIKNIYKDYSSGDDISPSSLKSIVKTMKNSKEMIKYFVIATIDVGLGTVDPSSGLKRVAIEISGRVVSVESGLPREVASVPPVQQASLGADETAARTAALKKGSEIASREIISQLNNLGIK
jgi:acetolactate synthase small subunit